MSELRLRKPYRLGDEYCESGRWPDEARKYEPEDLDDTIMTQAMRLPMLLASADPMDRVRAMVYVESMRHRVTVPAFVVVESTDSPNLNRDEIARKMRLSRRNVWSSHVDAADAEAWCTVIQRKHDADLAKHPWWGESSKRIFVVEAWADAPANTLRIPGADPERYLHAFE